MVTVADIIATAHRKIGVSGYGQELTGEQSDAGLFDFNAMIHGWRLEGIDFSSTLSPMIDGMDYEAGDDFPLPAAFREGAIYCLALRLSSDYSLPPMFNEADFKASMRAHLARVPTLGMDNALSRQFLTPESWRFKV